MMKGETRAILRPTHGRLFSLRLIRLARVLVVVTTLGQAPLLTAALAASSKTNLAASAGVSDSSIKALDTRLAEARANLAAAIALGDAGVTNMPAGVSPQDFWLRRALLQRLVRLYEQQISNAAELDTTKARKAELVRDAQAWTRFTEPPPYSILLTDRLREEIQAERLELSNGDSAVAMLDQLMEEQRAALTQAEEKIREKDLQFRKLSANVPDLLYQFTRRPDGTYFVPVASEGIKNIFGCSPEDVLEDFAPIGRVIFPEDSARVMNDIEYSARHLTFFRCEFRVQIPAVL